MNGKIHNFVTFLPKELIRSGGVLCLLVLFLPLAELRAQQAKPQSLAQDNQAVTEFNERIKQYLKLRGQSASKLDKPSNKTEPEKINAYQTALEERLRTMRAGAKPGDIFTPEIAEHIRNVIKQEFQGARLRKLKKDVAETKGVPVRVNYPYPERKEFAEMPPTLLLKLPQLPKELRYRFVGRDLLLVDREALLILDYVTDALP